MLKKMSVQWLLSLVIVTALASAGEAKTVITYAGHMTTKTVVEEAAQEYMALHPDVEIQHLYIRTDNYDGMNKILAMTIGGEMPDIIHASLSLTPELLSAGVLAPVPANLVGEVERLFLKPLIPTVMYKGQMYGIPTENQTYVLGYNKRLFDEAGVAGAPSSWGELFTFAKRLTKFDGADKVAQSGFGISGVSDYLRFSHTFLNFLWSNGGTYIDDNYKSHLNEPAAKETVEFLASMYAPGYLSLTNSMRNEKAAMASTPTYYRGSLIKLHDYAEMRTTLFPNNKGPRVAYQYGWAMFVANSSTKAEIAWDFLRFLTMVKAKNGSTRIGDKLVSVVGALPASRLDLERDEFRKDPFFGGYIQSLEVSMAEPVIPQVNLRLDELFKAIKPAVEGKISATQAVEDAHMRVMNVLAGISRK